jgi:uncharacterized membrane protein YbhN (UPF0104 family)
MTRVPADGSIAATRLARRALLLPALVVGAVAGLALLPQLEPVRDRFAATNAVWVLVALGLQLASTLSFVAAFRGAFDRRIGWRAAFDLAAVEQGANILLPSGGSGGLVLGATLLIRAGVPASFAARRTAVLFVVTSAASFTALVLAGGAVAAGVLDRNTSVAAALGPAIAAALVMLAVVQLPHRLPLAAAGGGRVRRALRRVQMLLRDAVDTSLELIRRRDALVVGGAIGYLAFDVASLEAAFHALGHAALPLGPFVLAYVLGHAGALVPAPGSAEGGLVAMLVAYGSPLSLVVGAVLVYRTFHAGVPLALAAAGYADIRTLRRRRRPGEDVARRFTSEPNELSAATSLRGC